MTKNTETLIEMIYSDKPDEAKSRSSLAADHDAPSTPATIHCPKCQQDVIPKHRGLCANCGRFLASNKLAQRYFEDTSARKKYLDRLMKEYQPSTAQAITTTELLANILAALGPVRCGTPEHARLIASSVELFATLEPSRPRPVEASALEHLSNADSRIEHWPSRIVPSN